MINFDEHKNLSKFEKDFLSELLNDINKREHSSWTKPWDFIEAQNAFSKHKYSGINSLYLELISRTQKLDDPRFATYNQASKNGYYIEKGSKGIPIQFFTFINKETKKKWNERDFKEKTKNMTPTQKKEELKKKSAVAKTFHVFNAKNIISKENNLSLSENKPIVKFNKKINTNEMIDTFEENLIQGMNLKVNEIHSEGAYYTPSTDEVTMPLKEQFNTYEDRMATLFHETGHATGHESRLDRDLSGTFGSANYSKEELKVEINSVFMVNTLGLNISKEQKKNHLLYLDNWGKHIQNDPKEFLFALRDSLKIKEYMIEKGKFTNIFLEEDTLSFFEQHGVVVSENLIDDKDYKHLVNFQLSHYENVEEVIIDDWLTIVYIPDIEKPDIPLQTYSNYKELWETHFKNDFIHDLNNFTLYELKNNTKLSKAPNLLNRLSRSDKEIHNAIINTKKYQNSIKDIDLDNDGIPDRIDIDDSRNSVQTVSDLYEVSNRTDKTYINQEKQIKRTQPSR